MTLRLVLLSLIPHGHQLEVLREYLSFRDATIVTHFFRDDFELIRLRETDDSKIRSEI